MEATKNNPPYVLVILIAVVILVFLWIVNIFNISYPISITNRTVSGELSVVGEGKVDVVPDTATFQAGIVVSDAKTVKEAESQINEVNNKIVAAMTALGIKKEDIKTSNYSINPNYDYSIGTRGNNTISGYNGSANLTVKVRKTDLLPQAVEAATSAGANQVYDTQYIVDNPDKYREEARAMAINNAKDQAKKLSSELGIRLGRIVNIAESTPGQTVPYLSDSFKAMPEARIGVPAPDLQAGSQTITSTVTLYFEKR